MKILALIPARMASSRFPGKPLAPILGKAMIGHVYEQVARCTLLTTVAVATCDEEIKNYIESIGGTAVITQASHERASDRCAEALLRLEETNGFHYDVVVMVQGDEPMVKPEMIGEALQPLLVDSAIQVVNLLAPIKDEAEFRDRNCIKVVCNLQSDALYFSREPIPTRHLSLETKAYKQVCIIPFRRDFLLEYANMTPTPLELAESIDMLRILEHGLTVRMVPTQHETHAVDTPVDLKRVENLLAQAND